VFDQKKLIHFLLCVLVSVSTSKALSASPDEERLSAQGAEFSVDGHMGGMYPAFHFSIRHYAVRCKEFMPLTFSVKSSDQKLRFWLDEFRSLQPGTSLNLVPNSDDQTFELLSIGTNTETQFWIHCIPEDFPVLKVQKFEEHISSGLFLLAARVSRGGEKQATYVMNVDQHGVPRKYKKIIGLATNYQRELDGSFSFLQSTQKNEFGFLNFEYVQTDNHFNVIRQQSTVGLNHTDLHESFLTEQGTLFLMAYNSSLRDMSAFGAKVSERTRDSVIQEIGPKGKVLFEWNSWDHLDLGQCKQHRFPDDYAHLNSISLAPENSLIVSMRGCSQVLKIDRTSGEVIWRLGAGDSDFKIVGDPMDEFCGQHTAFESRRGTLILFDNGGHCFGERESLHGRVSRVVEYALDPSKNTATLLKSFYYPESKKVYTPSGGSVVETQKGNLVVSWNDGPRPSFTEFTPLGETVLHMQVGVADAHVSIYRVYKIDAENHQRR
jgi:hypothetical protein